MGEFAIALPIPPKHCKWTPPDIIRNQDFENASLLRAQEADLEERVKVIQEKHKKDNEPEAEQKVCQFPPFASDMGGIVAAFSDPRVLFPGPNPPAHFFFHPRTKPTLEKFSARLSAGSDWTMTPGRGGSSSPNPPSHPLSKAPQRSHLWF